jgi:alkanesulfonate monooxygenase SsuD/methylene tetrahydromethanopterin reductase-like flavin-dependent oxidoreductase (luciferase family)
MVRAHRPIPDRVVSPSVVYAASVTGADDAGPRRSEEVHMRYGLEISAAGACGDARTLADLAQLAEESGWDGVFLEDYIIHYDPTYVQTYDLGRGELPRQALPGGWKPSSSPT